MRGLILLFENPLEDIIDVLYLIAENKTIKIIEYTMNKNDTTKTYFNRPSYNLHFNMQTQNKTRGCIAEEIN